MTLLRVCYVACYVVTIWREAMSQDLCTEKISSRKRMADPRVTAIFLAYGLMSVFRLFCLHTCLPRLWSFDDSVVSKHLEA